MTGPLIIVSGPSGVGKSTIIQRLLADWPGPLRLSVSATTRLPRPNERDGVDYHFWTRERFTAGVTAGESSSMPSSTETIMARSAPKSNRIADKESASFSTSTCKVRNR